MNIQNVASLAETLQSFGFASDLEYRLLQNICFRRPDFIIKERMLKGADIMNYSLSFKSSDNEGDYECIYYDATLRKEIIITSVVINSINTKELEKLMQEIDWSADFDQHIEKQFLIESKDSWAREEKIDKVVAQLHSLASIEEGANIADCLKFKFWCDTPIHEMINNLNVLKSRFEISQRFYLFNNSCISADEAYRFLNNRWMEKTLQTKKKQAEDKEGEDGSSAAARGITGKNFLQKKSGNKGRKLKIQ